MMSTRVRRLAAMATAALLMAISAVLVLGRTSDTVAAYVDKVVGGSVFDASNFGIEGAAPDPTDGSLKYGDHTTEAASAVLTGSTNPGTVAFTTPIALAPGTTTYAPLYLRTTRTSVAAAVVTMSAATQRSGMTSDAGLWGSAGTKGAITYRARVIEVAYAGTCSANVFNNPQGRDLIPTGSAMSATPINTFVLPEKSGIPRMVCFEFKLRQDAAAAVPSSNGKSIYPGWTFTGQSQ